MDTNFWIKKWDKGEIGFHRDSYQDALVRNFSKLGLEKGARALVPLCGKTLDLIFLARQGLHVKGVELSEKAAQAFFSENGIAGLEIQRSQNFTEFVAENLTISCGDFFKLDPKEKFDLVYDRASMVALPPDMRKAYARVITNAVAPGGKYLLIVFEYNQEEFDGPPFSVDRAEIEEHYGKDFSIEQLEEESPSSAGPKLSAVESFVQKVYLLTKFTNHQQ